jgi:hypothetical protein
MSPAGQVANINCSFVICCVISVPANLLMPFWLLVLLRDAARFCAFVS